MQQFPYSISRKSTIRCRPTRSNQHMVEKTSFQNCPFESSQELLRMPNIFRAEWKYYVLRMVFMWILIIPSFFQIMNNAALFTALFDSNCTILSFKSNMNTCRKMLTFFFTIAYAYEHGGIRRGNAINGIQNLSGIFIYSEQARANSGEETEWGWEGDDKWKLVSSSHLKTCQFVIWKTLIGFPFANFFLPLLVVLDDIIVVFVPIILFYFWKIVNRVMKSLVVNVIKNMNNFPGGKNAVNW